MGSATAFDETVVFPRYFEGLPDPRQPGKVIYPLDEILLLCVVAVLAGADCFTEIALFGVKKLEFLRRFRPYCDGTPTHDHLGDILATLDSEAFQRCFVAWIVEQKANGFKDSKISRHRTINPDHGRIETRDITVIHDVARLLQRHDWPGLKGVVMVERTREIGDKIETETRFHITTLVWLACLPGSTVRNRWVIENSLHWVLDMVFRDDACRVRTDHAPANFTTIKHRAESDQPKVSARTR